MPWISRTRPTGWSGLCRAVSSSSWAVLWGSFIRRGRSVGQRRKFQAGDVKEVLKLRSETYPNGYRIDELGDAKPRQLKAAFDGDLLCPFLASSSNEKKVVF